MKSKILQKGFTLVELLIVIALIAILSVAVLSTINPIEQSNKARDAKFKNDAAEVLGAYERYYASKNIYPWNDNAIGTTIPIGTGKTILGDTAKFGIVSESGVGTTGILITTDELKASFVNKDPWKSQGQTVDDMTAITDGQSSNYVCFCPKAMANRTDDLKMKCIDVANKKVTAVGIDTCIAATDPKAATFCDAPSAAKANVMCVPE
ncbi:MAG: type II secretion system protein [Candidatus Shapirobacteria bacterium]